MALLGFSLILASVVWFCMRPPAWFPSLFGAAAKAPIAPPPPPKDDETKPDARAEANSVTKDEPQHGDSRAAKGQPAVQLPTPPPPVIQLAASPEPSLALGSPGADSACDGQTTPKASAAVPNTPVPAFALSTPEPTPSVSKPSTSAPTPSASILMPPPPRPPTL
ncbi:hypothetical protein C8A05DRAFT_35661, partial [Staphylotrichum tortipilum]